MRLPATVGAGKACPRSGRNVGPDGQAAGEGGTGRYAQSRDYEQRRPPRKGTRQGRHGKVVRNAASADSGSPDGGHDGNAIAD